MSTKKYKPEQIVNLLRQIEVEIANDSGSCRVLANDKARIQKDETSCGARRLRSLIIPWSSFW
ncbi:MAG: hypothetical protein ABSB82_10865 [Terriglobia bacterium]|jgi:hypothetical protein